MEEIKTDAFKAINEYHKEKKQERLIQTMRDERQKERERVVSKQRKKIYTAVVIAATASLTFVAQAAYKDFTATLKLQKEFNSIVAEEGIAETKDSAGVYICNDRNGFIEAEDAAYRAYHAAKQAGMSDAEILIGENGAFDSNFLITYIDDLKKVTIEDKIRTKQLTFLNMQKEKLENTNSEEITRGGLR